jgi:uncharacterized protein YdhG (YjbR/CyaY superfamily)
MAINREAAKDIDDYIQRHPEPVQELLQKMRLTIQKAAPEATEKISYAIPTFFLNGSLVHFAAFRNHIGFYPTGSGIAAFQKELSKYKSSKGAVQFPLGSPLPPGLVSRMVKFRVRQSREKQKKRVLR